MSLLKGANTSHIHESFKSLLCEHLLLPLTQENVQYAELSPYRYDNYQTYYYNLSTINTSKLIINAIILTDTDIKDTSLIVNGQMLKASDYDMIQRLFFD
jgi:hypothetical protein